MKYYIFKISYYDEYQNKEIQVPGLVAGNSYSSAVDAIIKDWGGNDDSNIISLDFLMPIEDISETLTLNEAMFHMFFNGHNERKIKSYYLADKFDFPEDACFKFPEKEGELK